MGHVRRWGFTADEYAFGGTRDQHLDVKVVSLFPDEQLRAFRQHYVKTSVMIAGLSV